MFCIYCNADTHVIDSRILESSIRRRRECMSCQKRFTTYESPTPSIIVVKKDGRREEFSREKLISGMEKSCQKRPVSREAIEKAADEITRELAGREEVQAKDIGELVIAKLKALDEVAYIRFASVYREFKDISDFEKEARKLK